VKYGEKLPRSGMAGSLLGPTPVNIIEM